jgi:hypothetical protein
VCYSSPFRCACAGNELIETGAEGGALKGKEVGFVTEEEGSSEEEANKTITTQKATVQEGEEVVVVIFLFV